MTPEQRQQIETQIKNDFTEVQKKLNDLKTEVQIETDAAKKQKKIEEIQRLEKELAEMKDLIDRITYLHEEELLALKSKLDEYKEYKQEILDIRKVTPTTYEILKDSETYDRLINIISSNPNEFKNLPGDTAEKKLEYIFTKIRSSIVLFMKNKLGESSSTEYVINNTIAPAFEWSLLELLTIQGNETNVNMLQGIDNISFKKLGDLINGVGDFSKKMSGSYNKFNQWMNAIDYLSVHNGVLSNPKKSAVLTNPLKFEAYMNNSKFGKAGFSPYAPIEGNIFEISDDENFEFGLSSTEEILKKIGDIKVENNPRTTSLIAKMIDKPEKFLKKTDGLQKTANGLLDGLNSVNITFKTFGIDKILGTDILGEFTKAPEKRSFWYRIVDFVCKLIGITGGLEGIVKRWRLDRMNLTDEKNHNISEIFKWYQKAAGENVDLNITDDDSCKAALADFAVTDFDDSPTTKGDYLRDSIIYNMNLSLISPAVVSQALEQNVLSKSREEYLKEEVVIVKGKQQKKITIIPTGFTPDDIKNLAQNHLKNMKAHLEAYDDNELQDFYTSIKSTEDLALCITTSLYADVDDVIEGVKAKIFLPENYGSVHSDGTVNEGNNLNENGNENDNTALSELTTHEKSELQWLVVQSKTPNSINYLENSTYKKYQNIIERDLKLPKYALECVCRQESGGKLYNGNKLIGSEKGAQGLFQFMPSTANSYMKHPRLQKYYGKTFSSRDEFLKDPLATAWAAGIMYAEFMNRHKYNFQTSLACYNRGIGNYQTRIGNKNLRSEDMSKLPNETRQYVEKISKDILKHNGVSSSDILLADLGQYSWDGGNIEGRVFA